MALDKSLDVRHQRLAELKRKLKARSDNPAYAENCDALREQIANLESVIAQVESGGLDL